MIVRNFISGICILAAASACEQGAPATPTQETTNGAMGFLETHNDARIETTHSLKYTFETNEAFSIIGPDHRSATFGQTPFEVSRAAFISEAAAIMIHAETVADNSGASNYDDLPAADWPSEEFRSHGPVCIELTQEDITGEADPEWLIANGFNILGNLMFGQYFASSPDYNEEVVVSLILHVSSCSTEDANLESYGALQSALIVSKID